MVVVPMRVLVIEPMFSTLSAEDISVLMPNLLRSIGLPPSSLILDRAGANLGLFFKAWADRMELPVELMEISPFGGDLEMNLVQHIRAVEKADACIAFWKSDVDITQQAVRTTCARRGIPLVVFYAW
jgi:hypothetical protein